ncbi:MAG: TadE family protein [Elusimicrobiota bacterium]
MKLVNDKGQAIVETVIFIPILIMLVSMIFWAINVVLTKQQLVSAARFGTDMIYYTEMGEETIKEEIVNYLCGEPGESNNNEDEDREAVGRKLDTEKIQEIIINIDRSGGLLNLGLSKVSIKYVIDVPKVFTVMAKAIRAQTEDDPEGIIIEGKSAILAGFEGRM